MYAVARVVVVLGALAALACGCGRLGFDTRSDGGSAIDATTRALDAAFVGSSETYVKASNTDVNDEFGFAVALSADGTTLAIGADEESSAATGIDGDQADNSALNAGAVYVFTRVGGAWQQQAYLKPSNTGAGFFFGLCVSLSADGNTLAAGAFLEDGGSPGVNGDQANQSVAYSGAAYVFTRTGATWTQQAYVKASNPDVSDEFGDSVALSGDGNTLAVAAYTEDSAATGIDGDQADNSATDSGAVYVFTRTGTTWAQQAYVKASNTDAGDEFGGVRLSDDGNTLAVVAGGEASAATGIDGDQADNSAPNAGAAYVFARVGTTWTQQAYVKASNTDAGDSFGANAYSFAVAADGNTLAVGATGEASAASGIDGDQADNSLPAAGAVYVFTRAGTAWAQQAYVKASNPDAQDQFGYEISLSSDGSSLAISAPGESSNASGLDGDQADNSATRAGAVYLDERVGVVWSQHAYIKASNPDAGDRFGAALAVSGDGSTLAAGAPNEASSATGIDGDQADNSAMNAGAVYVIR